MKAETVLSLETLLSLLLSLTACSFGAQPLISDGSFEGLGTGTTVQYSTGQMEPPNGKWYCVGSVETDSSIVWETANGSRSLDLNGTGIGAIYQDIATADGTSYLIRFAYAGNYNYDQSCGNTSAEKTFKVLWGDYQSSLSEVIPILSFDVTGRGQTDMGWTYYEVWVTASSSTSRLKFESTMTGSCGAALDDISVVECDACVSIAATDATASEPEGANTDPGTFTITRTGSTDAPLRIPSFAVSGTAGSGVDYTSIGTSTLIPASSATGTLTVSPIDDSNYERDESVIVTLSNDDSATITVQSVFELEDAYSAIGYAVNEHGVAASPYARHAPNGTVDLTFTSVARDINNSGEVCGNGFVYYNNTTYSLGSGNVGYSINEDGDVVGNGSGGLYFWAAGNYGSPTILTNDTGLGIGITSLDYVLHSYGFVMLNGSDWVELPDYLYPGGINEAGTVVGTSYTYSPGKAYALVLTLGAYGYGSSPLFHPGDSTDDTQTFAEKINNNGKAVGHVYDPNFSPEAYRAVIWDINGNVDYLDDLIGDPDWKFSFAMDISDTGHIVGQGKHNDETRGFLIRR